MHLCFLVFPLLFGLAAFSTAYGERPLPFDPQILSRLSVAERPRSLAVCQGQSIWLGYDLEQAQVFQCWQAPEGEPGLRRKDFTTQPNGKSLFQMKASAKWQWNAAEASVSPSIRYLGCSDRGEYIELRWELHKAERVLQLYEHVHLAAPAGARVLREIRVSGLQPGESLTPPGLGAGAWQLATQAGADVTSIANDTWHRLSLP